MYSLLSFEFSQPLDIYYHTFYTDASRNLRKFNFADKIVEFSLISCYAFNCKEVVVMATFRERLIEAMRIRDIDRPTIIRLTGIDKGAFSSYVNGKYNAGQTNLYLLAKALNVNEAWLMGHDVPMERNASLSAPLPETFDGFAEAFNKLSPAAQQQALDYMKFLAMLEQQGK